MHGEHPPTALIYFMIKTSLLGYVSGMWDLHYPEGSVLPLK